MKTNIFNINKDILRMSVKTSFPAMIDTVFVSIIASFITALVSRQGTNDVSVLAITIEPRFILVALVVSINIGIIAVVSRRKGESNRRAAVECMKQGILLTIAISFVISVIGVVFSSQIMYFMGAREQVLIVSTLYLKIISIGNFFLCISLTINSAHSGSGNTKISMRTNLISNIIMLVLNFVFVCGFCGFKKYGVIGSAYATLIGNIVSFIISITTIIRSDNYMDIRLCVDFKFNIKLIKKIFNVSKNAILEQIFIRFGQVFTAKVIASIGMMEFSTFYICINLVNIVFYYGDGLGIALSSLIGQSLGSNNKELACKYFNTIRAISLIGALFFVILFIYSRNSLIRLFSTEILVCQLGAKMLIIAGIMAPIQTQSVILARTLRGAGDTKYVAFVSLLIIAFIRPFSTWLFSFVLGFGIYGAWLGYSLDQTLRVIFFMARYKSGKWVSKNI